MRALAVIPDHIQLEIYPNLRAALAESALSRPDQWKIIQGSPDPSASAGILRNSSPEMLPATPYLLCNSTAAHLQGHPPWETDGWLRSAFQRSAIHDRTLHEALLSLMAPDQAASVLILTPEEASELCVRDPVSVLHLPTHLKRPGPYLKLVDQGYPLTRSIVPMRLFTQVLEYAKDTGSKSLQTLVNLNNWDPQELPACIFSEPSHLARSLIRALPTERLNDSQLASLARNPSDGLFMRALQEFERRLIVRHGAPLPADWLPRWLDDLFPPGSERIPEIRVAHLGAMATHETVDAYLLAIQKFSPWSVKNYPFADTGAHLQAIANLPEPTSVEAWESYAGMPAFPILARRFSAPESAILLAARRAKTLDALPEHAWTDDLLSEHLLHLPAPQKGRDTRPQFQAVLRFKPLTTIRPDALVRLLDLAIDAPSILCRSQALNRSLAPQSPGRLAAQEIIDHNPELATRLIKLLALAPSDPPFSPPSTGNVSEEFYL